MRSSKLGRGIVGAVLGVAVTLVIGMAGATARAQYRDYGQDRYGYGGDVSRIAYDQGYRDGIQHGEEHRGEGHRYDYAETRHYKDATSGYRSGYGSKDAYKQAYRDGFRRGYDVGYRGDSGGYDDNPYYRNDPYREAPYYRNDPYYRSGGYGRYEGDIYQMADDQGYRDGIQHGQEHRYQGHRYDYAETRHYKDADSGYRSSYGSKEAYKQAYREGFRRGYDEGYGSGGRYGDYGRGRSRIRWPF